MSNTVFDSASYNSLTYNDIVKGVFSMDDPMYMLGEGGAAVEFLLSASDDIYDEFAKRTPLLKENGYDNLDDLDDDDCLDIYVIVHENKAIEAVIGLHYGGKYYPVPLSDSEQKDLYTFIARFCKGRIGQSLDDMLAEVKNDANESALDYVYGKEFVEELKNKGKVPESRGADER